MKSGIIPFECDKTHCPAYASCDLVPTQVRVASGTTIPDEVVLFLGDAVGRQESSSNMPFQGKAGDLLRKTLRKLNVRKATLAYSSLARYWPKNENGERCPPASEAVMACREHLEADIEKIKPSKIVLLGSRALKALFPEAPPIAKARGQHFNHATLGKIFVTYDPNMVLKKQNLFYQWEADLQLMLSSDKLVAKNDKWAKPYTYRLLDNIEDIENYVEELLSNKKIKIIAVDTETKNLNVRYGNVLGTIQICEDGKRGTVIPYHHPKAGWWPDELKRLDAALVKLFTTPEPPWKYWVFHNVGFDYRMFFNFSLGIVKFNRPMMDTGMMAYCQDENRGKSGIDKPYSLDSLLRDYLKVEKYEDPEIERIKKQGKLLEIELDRLARYGASDSVYTFRLFFHILERAEREGYKKKLLNLCENWFEPANRMNSIMQSNGFWVDMKQLRLLRNPKTSPIVKRMEEIAETWKTLPNAIEANRRLLKYELGGKMKTLPGLSKDAWVFSIDKTEHKLCLFFDVMGLEPLDYGKGIRTPKMDSPKGHEVKPTPVGKLDKAFQDRYSNVEEVELYHEYQGLKKLRTSYVKSIFEFLDPRGGNEGSKDMRVRPSFWLTTTDTGRSSCTSPNLQQVPRSLVYHTLISSDKGLLEIGQLVEKSPNDLNVSCLNNPEKVTEFHATQHRKAISLTTRFGFNITGSSNHKMFVWDSARQKLVDKQLKDISTDNDYLLLGRGVFPCQEELTIKPENNRVYKNKWDGPEANGWHPYTVRYDFPVTVNSELAKILGYLTAEGHFSDNCFSFHNKDLDLIEDYTKALEKCFPGVHYNIRKDKRDDTYTVEVSSMYLLAFLAAQGCKLTTAHHKEVPTCILNSPRNVILSFLAAYIAGDGSIECKYNNSIRFHSASRKLMEQLHVLTSTLGWVGSISTEKNRNGDNIHKVVFYGEDSVKMLEEVNWVSPKQSSIVFSTKFSNDTKRIIPGLKKHLQQTLEKPYPVSNLRLRDDPAQEYTYSFLNKHPETVEAIRKLGYEDAIRLMDYTPVKVTSSKTLDFVGEMYDLTVNNNPYFLANGLVSHNSDNWSKKEIKNMFAAEPGCSLIQLDFMTSEVRWWGILSQCPSLAKAFENGKKAREDYKTRSAEFVDRYPKIRYEVVAAAEKMISDTFEIKDKSELNELNGKFPDKAIKLAYRLLTTNEDFFELVKAKVWSGVAGDLHKNTASQMYGVPLLEVTKNMRNDTKAIVFGTMFGRGPKAIAAQLKIDDLSDVQKRIRNFFDQFPDAEAWMYDSEKFGEENAYVESPIGRRRRLLTFQMGFGDDGEIARAKRVARNCVDTETEILTYEGWKTVDDISIGDKIYTRTMEGNIEVHPIDKINRGRHTGKVHVIDRAGFSSVSTPNHRWLVDKRYGADKKYITCFVTSENLPFHSGSDVRIHRTANEVNQNIGQWSNDEVEFLGWWLTDGSIRYYGSERKPLYLSIIQSQRGNPEKSNKIDNLFRRLGIAYHKGWNREEQECLYWETRNSCKTTKDFRDKILDFCPDRVLTPKLLHTMSTTQLKLLLHTMLLGDGCWDEYAGRYRRFCTGNKQQADAFSMLCTLLGLAHNVKYRDFRNSLPESSKMINVPKSDGVWLVELNKRKYAHPGFGSRWEDFDGEVWCPTVTNGTWFARRKGTTYWTGNSPIQGISSDGAFLGASMFSEHLIDSGRWHVHPDKNCWLLQDVVHDSLVLQVPLEDVPEALKEVEPFFSTKLMGRMEKVWGVHFNIPLEVDFELGLKWGDLNPWDGTRLHLDYLMKKLRKESALR